mmetsp:Transcript_2171/g.5170  ORF Transcript_2171/g.5170 Transcript_2171/m.5170 type:complete len:200 (-) Transcript_2171:36-635(-)
MAPFLPTTSHSSPAATTRGGGEAFAETSAVSPPAGSIVADPVSAKVPWIILRAQLLEWLAFSFANSSSTRRSCCRMQNSLRATFSATRASVSLSEAKAADGPSSAKAASTSSTADAIPSAPGMSGKGSSRIAFFRFDMAGGRSTRALAARGCTAGFTASTPPCILRSCLWRSSDTSERNSQFSRQSSSFKSPACSRSWA